MVKVPVPVAELFDKLTILRIKKDKGLNVAEELQLLEDLAKGTKPNRLVTSFVSMLHTVNSLLWDIEDDKREYEVTKDFDEKFIELARLVYILNDRRADLKKQINIHSGSVISEVKKYKEY